MFAHVSVRAWQVGANLALPSQPQPYFLPAERLCKQRAVEHSLCRSDHCRMKHFPPAGVLWRCVPVLPNAVPNTFQDAKSEQEGAAGIPPVKELLSLQWFFPLLSCCCLLKDKVILQPAWTIFFCDRTPTQSVMACSKIW